MTRTITPLVKIYLCTLLFVMLTIANALPVSAATVTGQPGMMKALGQPFDAVNTAASADLLLVRRGGGNGRKAGRGGGGRKSGRGGRGGRRDYGGGGGGRREYRGSRGGQRAYRKRGYGGSRSRSYFYYGLPFYGYAPYYNYYSYRPSSGRCEYWSRRCVANWGYRNSNYYGCMRYYGCR